MATMNIIQAVNDALRIEMRKDPLLRLAAFLRGRGVLAEADEARIAADARSAVQRAIQEAEAHPARPPVETLFQHVYAEPLRQQREQLEELEGAIAADPRVANPRHSDA